MAFRMIETSCPANTAVQLTTERYGVRQIIMQSPAANEDIYIGDANVSILHYAHKFTTGTEQELVIGPFSGDAPLNSNEIWLWTAGDDPTVHSILITH